MSEKIYTIATHGLKGILVEVEANLSWHLPKVIVVGLPDTSVQEAKERVWAAIDNSGTKFPRQKVVINLAPAQIRKEGGSYDLSMAVAVLQAAGDVTLGKEKVAFIGELALTGDIKPVPGILVMVASLKDYGFKKVFVPQANAKEASIIRGIEILPVAHLRQVIAQLNGQLQLAAVPVTPWQSVASPSEVDLADIRGQLVAKRVLEIAASGGHNLFLVGPPGAGKSMLAKAFLSILPDLSLEQALEVSKIYSLAGLLSEENYLIKQRILRSPHHSASVSAIIGGGSWPKPGEISLAHHNVLFLDEILEFPRKVLEALRQPLEDRVITVSRVKGSLDFPANFILLATANPCPCGYLTDADKECQCSLLEIKRYQKRLSGPVLDRIDLHLLVDKVKSQDLQSSVAKAESSNEVKQRVTAARLIQTQRFASQQLNAAMSAQDIKKYCHLSAASQQILSKAVDTMGLTARGYFKVLKVARTIADLEASVDIAEKHILEALQYRNKILAEL